MPAKRMTRSNCSSARTPLDLVPGCDVGTGWTIPSLSYSIVAVAASQRLRHCQCCRLLCKYSGTTPPTSWLTGLSSTSPPMTSPSPALKVRTSRSIQWPPRLRSCCAFCSPSIQGCHCYLFSPLAQYQQQARAEHTRPSHRGMACRSSHLRTRSSQMSGVRRLRGSSPGELITRLGGRTQALPQ